MNTENFYNNYLNNSYNQPLLNQDESRQYHDYFINNFKLFLPKEKKAHILDIGIGNGRTLKTLKEIGYVNCFGIDIAKDLIKEAKKKGLPCEYVKNTNIFIDSNKEKYSFVFLSHVIEHIPKQEAVIFLEKIKNSLTEDGILAIITPNTQNIFYVGPFWDFTHVNFFTERSLFQLCEASGFKRIKLCSEKIPINTYGKGMLSYFRFFVSDILIRCMQFFVNCFIKFIRFGTGIINPKILSFNLICICKKK
jgi:SAM-dependent methyltransferase